jgi:hypothetical protein
MEVGAGPTVYPSSDLLPDYFESLVCVGILPARHFSKLYRTRLPFLPSFSFPSYVIFFTILETKCGLKYEFSLSGAGLLYKQPT